ncbi:hypothetical protein OEZ85_012192 [Tetradesmus obliquus]|uniref:N-acetyltransferase domain-containing protein n=1 Tax=Tetradesmus obliquus TaxID=3088 RepID=A0ABY8TSL2_TETOB|nr:hypothetical protein OEZ85_012192 [Tetradesmus obliquus]
MAPASCPFPSITVSVGPGFDAAADPLLGDCFREDLARGLHGQAGETGSNQLSAWHGWCTYWCGDNCYTSGHFSDHSVPEALEKPGEAGVCYHICLPAKDMPAMPVRRAFITALARELGQPAPEFPSSDVCSDEEEYGEDDYEDRSAAHACGDSTYIGDWREVSSALLWESGDWNPSKTRASVWLTMRNHHGSVQERRWVEDAVMAALLDGAVGMQWDTDLTCKEAGSAQERVRVAAVQERVRVAAVPRNTFTVGQWPGCCSGSSGGSSVGGRGGSSGNGNGGGNATAAGLPVWWAADGSYSLVARANGTFCPYAEPSDTYFAGGLHVELLEVRSDCRGKKFGKALLQLVEKAAMDFFGPNTMVYIYAYGH